MIPVALTYHWLLLHWPSVAGPGVVLSSINGRTETRTYAKIVRSGAGMQALSPEEEHAVRAARLGQGLPAAERVGHPEVTVRTRRSMPAA